MTILIDIDDVLNNLLECWLKCLNTKYQYNVKPEEVIDWNIRKFFPTLTSEQIFEPLNDIEFWKTVTPKKDAPKYLKQLFDEKNNIYLCTSTYYKNIQSKFEYFIKKYYPFIEWDKVIVAHNKQMINADILIDDGIHNLVGGNYTKILFAAPHNKGLDREIKKYGIIKVESWKEIYDIIKNI